MVNNELYSDEYLRIYLNQNNVMLETYKRGFQINQITHIFSERPELVLTNISALRSSIVSAPAIPVKIGKLKDKIDLEISPDELTAEVTFNLSEEELANTPKELLRGKLAALLEKNGIVFGINLGFINEDLSPNRPYIVAYGVPAKDGSDAIVRMYELTESKPEVGEGGKVDFYDMKLINRVKPGEWLGERIEATNGTPGKTITGEEIEPQPGRTAALVYDKNSVVEVTTGNKTTLVSKLAGAVNYTNDRINVSNHLEIEGDAGVATGNIKFDGYVTIKGSINDGFSVEATKDIEINGQYGLSNIKSLVSTQGSIYIKGGVSSRERLEITAAKSIYVKFADNVRLVCGETAHIGYYSINSEIIAKDVVFDSINGQVIGGCIKSEIHISVPICGSEMERKTTLEVVGFNRQSLVRRLDEVFSDISIKKTEMQKLKMQSHVSSSRNSSGANISDKLFNLKEEIKLLEEERKQIAIYLKTKGDGEISVSRRLYPNCFIILSGIYAETSPDIMAQTFYLKDGEIKMI